MLLDNFREESVSKVNSGMNTLIYVLAYAGMIFFGFFALMNLMSVLNGNFDIYVIIGTLITGGLAYLCFVVRNNQGSSMTILLPMVFWI